MDVELTNTTEFDADGLALQAKAGCVEAFNLLSHHFRPRLIAVLVSQHQSSTSDAEDAAQEALTRAFVNIERFDPQYSFSTWLFTIAVRALQDQRRKQHLDQKHAQTLEQAARSKLQSSSCNDEKSKVEIWHIAQEVLSPVQYRMLWLRYGEGRSVKQIAASLGKSSLTVRVTLHRARATLQQVWSNR